MENLAVNSATALVVVDDKKPVQIEVDYYAQKTFFETIAWEVDNLFKDDNFSSDISKFLRMRPAHILNSFIPSQLSFLDEIRTSQRECSRKLEDIKRCLDQSTNVREMLVDDKGFMSEYTYKAKNNIKNFLDNQGKAYDLLDDLSSHVIEYDFYNNRFNKLAEEVINSLAVVFGVVKIKNLIRYCIKCYGGKLSKIDLYRWVELDDVRNYDRQRWHYSIDFANKSLYIRRFDGKVVFCGSFDEFVNELI